MKIKIINTTYNEAIKIKPPHHKKPLKPSMFFRILMKTLSVRALRKSHFSCTKIDMEKLGKKEPALILMNHSCFIDMKIVPTLLFPRPFNIVATRDTFIGKDLLIRLIGCIPTTKFVADTTLVRDIIYAIRKLKSSVVMFPEAGYSLDGRATVLPDSLGKMIKMLGAPVVTIHTDGAFARDPLYNNLQLRKVDVSATEKYLLSPEEIKSMTPEEINDLIAKEFDFDNFKWQRENHIKIAEGFRADCLHRVLYKCPHCLAEGRMLGKGTELVCEACGKDYHLDEYGSLKLVNGQGKFDHVPDWFDWQRKCVREEIENGSYKMNVPVDIMMVIDSKGLYRVGEGRLVHDINGFVLDGCDGKLHYEQKPLASYTLNSEYYWYEIGDVMSIGTNDRLYYCFPKGDGSIVTKARLATEEIYKIAIAKKQAKDVEKATTG
ncbi:MAG: 1-acyl-sn-glycerol-3-phosphate acyltransferase [Clostridia bacterium]|nr:1-acyl-sn-glycerol-3-phosphate acyltransferase [Clostridia bacterium]